MNLGNRFTECQFELLSKIYKDVYTCIDIGPLDIEGSKYFANVSTMNTDHIFEMFDHGYKYAKNVINSV